MRHLTNRTAKGVIIIWILMIMIWMNCAGGRRPPEFAAWFAEEPGTSAGGGKRQAAAVERAPRPDVAAVERAPRPDVAAARRALRPDIAAVERALRPDVAAAGRAPKPDVAAAGRAPKPDVAAAGRALRPDVATMERATGPGAAIGRGGLITAPATVAVPTGTGDILKRDLRGRSACFSSSTAALICWHGEPRGAKGTAAAEIPARAGCWVSWLNGGI